MFEIFYFPIKKVHIALFFWILSAMIIMKGDWFRDLQVNGEVLLSSFYQSSVRLIILNDSCFSSPHCIKQTKQIIWSDFSFLWIDYGDIPPITHAFEINNWPSKGFERQHLK